MMEKRSERQLFIPNSEVENARPVLTPFGILSYHQQDNQSGGTGRSYKK
jgi:hypothetical protein